MPEHYDCKRFMFGDRWRFGIECEVQDCDVDPWGSREPFGSFWFWIGGHVVGNPNVAEQLVHAFAPFDMTRYNDADRKASDVPGDSHLDNLDFVIWLRFGEDEDFDPARWGHRDLTQIRQLNLLRYEVIPRGYSPFQDGWEAIVLEDSEQETFVWRRGHGCPGKTYELSLPVGGFANVLNVAGDWFTSLRSGHVADKDRSDQDRATLSVDPKILGFQGSNDTKRQK